MERQTVLAHYQHVKLCLIGWSRVQINPEAITYTCEVMCDVGIPLANVIRNDEDGLGEEVQITYVVRMSVCTNNVVNIINTQAM